MATVSAVRLVRSASQTVHYVMGHYVYEAARRGRCDSNRSRLLGCIGDSARDGVRLSLVLLLHHQCRFFCASIDGLAKLSPLLRLNRTIPSAASSVAARDASTVSCTLLYVACWGADTETARALKLFSLTVSFVSSLARVCRRADGDGPV
jgi:hypothetical protein